MNKDAYALYDLITEYRNEIIELANKGVIDREVFMQLFGRYYPLLALKKEQTRISETQPAEVREARRLARVLKTNRVLTNREFIKTEV